jgi:hypothetical protein
MRDACKAQSLIFTLIREEVLGMADAIIVHGNGQSERVYSEMDVRLILLAVQMQELHSMALYADLYMKKCTQMLEEIRASRS